MNERAPPGLIDALPVSVSADASQATSAEARRGAKGRHGLRSAAAAAACVLGIAGTIYFGWHYWTTGRFEVSTDDAYLQADSTIVAPKVAGYLREVLVADNEPVKRNQPLARIDDRDYSVALRQVRATVAAAAADTDNIKAQIQQQQSIISQSRATVQLDRANVTFAEQENDRYSSLARSGSGSIQNAQQAVSRLGIAKATLDRDDAALSVSERQTSVLQAQLSKSAAALESARAMETQAQLNLGYTTILSPVDGVVGNRTLRVGQYVQAGTALMSVVPINAVYVVANYKETQLTDVRPGQPVAVEVDTFPGRSIKGRVDSISPASGQEFALLPPDNATGNFTKIVQRVPVKIVLDEVTPLSGLLRPGMSVVPTIETKDRSKARP
jgi:membrane fusion protein (multidrug efflux system)